MPDAKSSPVWHPFTQHALQPIMVPIRSADGAWLETQDGKKILDAISSWWVITHGHRHPKIMATIRDQSEKLDQVIFAGFTHEPAETLANGLIDITPSNLTRAFYSDSGSTSVEVALKMALGFWRNRGEKRTRIIALEHAYHGDTVGTMSAGARGLFNAAYEPLLFDVARIPFPNQGLEQQTLDALEEHCSQNNAAALIVEPLILGAGGMLIYEPKVLSEIKRICEKHNVLFIADEVMTGWGRTGTLFACEQANVRPDILCIAKGITGGALPLAATLCSEEIFAAHYSKDRTKMFFHSSSYTANPIACAAACANLEIWRNEPVLDRIKKISDTHQSQLQRFKAHSKVSNPRQLGTIAALDVCTNDQGYMANIGPKLYQRFLDEGVLLRPLGNTIYIMPPYCITEPELKKIYDTIEKTVEKITSEQGT